MTFSTKCTDFNTFIYSQLPIRVHRKCDDSSVWIVGKDVCSALGLTNVSYISRKLSPSNIHTHRTMTPSGTQNILWFNLDAVREVIDTCNTYKASEFMVWLKSTVLPCVSSPAVNHTFREPVTIERETLELIRKLMIDLTSQGVFR